MGANGVFGLVKCFNTDGFCRICTCSKRSSETQVIPLVMKFVFDTAFNRKAFTSIEIICLIRDFNYGILSKRNKPSKIILTKSKLNQNAIQSINFILNLPFIFYDKKERLDDVWNILNLLLQIMQIIFSSEITEHDLNRLSNLISEFLESLVKNGIFLTPKCYNMTHYVTVIKNMGPLVHMWAMRAERKHKFFTNISRNTNCFKNITETLSSRHQQTAYLKEMFSDQIVPSKRTKKLVQIENFKIYKSACFSEEQSDFGKYYSHDFLKINEKD